MRPTLSHSEKSSHGSDDCEQLQRAIAAYLESRGWKVIVAGELQIRRPAWDLSSNFEFVMKFTGKKPVPTSEKTSDASQV